MIYSIEPLRVEGAEILHVRLSGPAHAETLLALMAELEGRAALRILVDETELGVGFVSPADIRRLADRWRKARALQSASIAVVAPNLAVYGLNRMFQGLAGATDRLAVFTDRTQALTWLRREDANRAGGLGLPSA